MGLRSRDIHDWRLFCKMWGAVSGGRNQGCWQDVTDVLNATDAQRQVSRDGHLAEEH